MDPGSNAYSLSFSIFNSFILSWGYRYYRDRQTADSFAKQISLIKYVSCRYHTLSPICRIDNFVIFFTIFTEGFMLIYYLKFSIDNLSVNLWIRVGTRICKVYLIIIVVKFYLKSQTIEISPSALHWLLLS